MNLPQDELARIGHRRGQHLVSMSSFWQKTRGWIPISGRGHCTMEILSRFYLRILLAVSIRHEWDTHDVSCQTSPSQLARCPHL